MRKNAIATFSLPPEIMTETEELAKEEKKTRSEVVREAIAQYYSNYKWRQLQKFGKKKAEELGLKTEQDVYNWLDKE
ncbi:MAG: ribbon-helix-helix protein, CopG family [Elusimicrobia bacterium]|nr:ribbon-helix-helix protein, CopG family [Elusimicrobiota bacterium]